MLKRIISVPDARMGGVHLDSPCDLPVTNGAWQADPWT